MKCLVNSICVASLLVTLSNVCGAALPVVEVDANVLNVPGVQTVDGTVSLNGPGDVAKLPDIVSDPFFLGCASNSLGVCEIDLSELPAGEVHLTYISGFSKDADANVIPVFGYGALFHFLPWQPYSQDTGVGMDVLYTQAVDLIWEADSIVIGEPGASSVVARVSGHVILDSSAPGGGITTRVSDFHVPEPSSATLLAGLASLLPFGRRLRRSRHGM